MTGYMNNKVLIVFAQTAEARATLEMTKATPIPGEINDVWSEGKVPSRYAFDQGWIAICGVGIHPAQICVSKYAHLCDEVWNLGFAGTLKEGLSIGEIVEISSSDKYLSVPHGLLDPQSLECATFSLPSCKLNSCGKKLISSDFPIHESTQRKQLSAQWDLVDMEGYGIAYACRELGKKCRMWKIVSDFASCGGRELIRKYCNELSRKIAETVMGNL